MTVFSKLTLFPFPLSSGEEGDVPHGMKPRSVKDDRKSVRRDVMSRMVDIDMKFYENISSEMP